VESIIYGQSPLTEYDIHLFREGTHTRLYEKLGAHPMQVKGIAGTHFAVWAPNAKAVSVISDFNQWNPDTHPLQVRWDGSGIWEGFIPGVGQGALYKYFIRSHHNNYSVRKGDPFAFCWETPPRTASVVWDLTRRWQDRKWLAERVQRDTLRQPQSIYEVHPGSWRRKDGNQFQSWRELARELAAYVREMGFTHVEFLPVMEHPFYGSWGYQTTGYFAPTSRFGPPQDFMYLIEHLHRAGIGVILDWVPSHFPADEHSLSYFDGTHLYEHRDPRKGFHPDWNSCIFNYGRNEVRSFLLSSAHFWLDRYHADALRVDAVASMLYLDYSRKPGEWLPNEHGGRENLDAISLIRRLNETIYADFPGAQTIAEESTAFPMVSRPTSTGGLGFGMKWDMGWMHDTLKYFGHDPVHRKYHHNELTFSIWYAFWENFVLPLSHDEVVYGKGSLLRRMPGDERQKFANLRLLFGYMFTHPGKKLLFMGDEFGQWDEWNHEKSLDWHLLQPPTPDPQPLAPSSQNPINFHLGIQHLVQDLNRLYREEPALHELDFESDGFRWLDWTQSDDSTLAWLRFGKDKSRPLLVVANFTPVPRTDYRVGIPFPCDWQVILNSNHERYGGSDLWERLPSRDRPPPAPTAESPTAYRLPPTVAKAQPLPWQDQPCSLLLTLPPLAICILRPATSH
jgi:1,4-alpha-glucan branching enzyme